MNFYYKTLLVGLVAIFTGQLFAQISPTELSSRFFSTFEKEGSTKALDELYLTNPWMNKASDAILELKNKMEGLNEEYVGKYYGYELIVEKRISDSYVLRSYLVRFDRQPLRYTFQFYKPDNEWRMFGFQYDGNLDDELEESAKLHYINYGEK